MLPENPDRLPPNVEELPPNPVGFPPKLVLAEKLPKAPAGAVVLLRPRIGGPNPAKYISIYHTSLKWKQISLNRRNREI